MADLLAIAALTALFALVAWGCARIDYLARREQELLDELDSAVKTINHLRGTCDARADWILGSKK